MADPIVFPSATPNLSLPLLFAGQAQKEPFINHAVSMVDALLIGTVVDSLSSPPSDPQPGTAYRILENATGEWTGHENQLAAMIGGAWDFVEPSMGMAVFDQTAGIQLRYLDGWETATEPVAPTGGTTVDTQARAAIGELIEALRSAGIL